MTKKKELASWKEAAAASIKEVAAKEGGDFLPHISTKGGNMTYRKELIPGNNIDTVVVAAITERSWFDQPYRSDKIIAPACYAKAEFDDHMVPSPNARAVQSQSCAACPLAVFGSAPTGKGPACKTKRALVVMPGVVEGMDPAEAELATIVVPPTSVKHWKRYVTALASKGLAPWTVVTNIRTQPGKFMFDMLFKAEQPLPEDILPGVHSRIPEAMEYLMRDYDYSGEAADDEQLAAADAKAKF